MTYKRSRRGNTEIDRAWSYVLEQSGEPYEILEFSPYGYDEKAILLRLALIYRSGPLCERPSVKVRGVSQLPADNLDFVRPDALYDTLTKAIAAIDVIENNGLLSEREAVLRAEMRWAIMAFIADWAGSRLETFQMGLLWVLNMSDGDHSRLDIAERSMLPWAVIRKKRCAEPRVFIKQTALGPATSFVRAGGVWPPIEVEAAERRRVDGVRWKRFPASTSNLSIPDQREVMIQRVALIVGWVVLVFITFATPIPIQGRPRLAGLQLEHFVAFAVMGFVFARIRRRTLAVLAMVILSALALEGMQLLTPDRHGRSLTPQ